MKNERKAVSLRAPHDAGEIIGYAYRLYARHFLALFLLGLTTAPLQMLAGVIQDRAGNSNGGQLGIAGLQLLSALVILVATGALIHAVNDIASGQAPDFNRSLDAAFERFAALLTTNLLGGVLTLLSVIAIPYFVVRRRFDAALSVPYFVVRWNFSPQAVMLEGKRNWAALDASSSIVKGRWWRTLGVLLLITLVAIGPFMIAGAAQALPAIAAATVLSAVFALMLPFIVGAQTLLYYDLRARTLQLPIDEILPPPAEDAGQALPPADGPDGDQ